MNDEFDCHKIIASVNPHFFSGNNIVEFGCKMLATSTTVYQYCYSLYNA